MVSNVLIEKVEKRFIGHIYTPRMFKAPVTNVCTCEHMGETWETLVLGGWVTLRVDKNIATMRRII